ncbi:hypothetical protein [Bacillus sp. JJ783]|uniref:Y-family DNA polymerase n=1 Tax=Bacillus sp. RIT 809 TaxID=2803857 RepID=UPI002FFEA02C
MYDYSLCLDLVSFFASVSCVKLGYDPLQTKLAVVSDTARPGSVVLAATKPLKLLGIKQGSRLYELANIPGVLVVNPQMDRGTAEIRVKIGHIFTFISNHI